MLKPLVVIVGPTAVGKSEVGIKVAQSIGGEIISGDSMQVYRGMDIGTAKVTPVEMQGIPHHMIDIMEPHEEFSVALFKEKVTEKVSEIQKKGKLPLIVGGTGLYIRSVIDPYDFTSVKVDSKYRNYLQEQASVKGNEYIHNQLALVDPEGAQRLHPNDTRRIIRALEVYRETGKPISEYQVIKKDHPPKYNLLMFGLNMDREKLYQRINQRVDMMMSQGLVDEVSGLLKKGYTRELISMNGLGYKEIIGFLEGEYDLQEAIYLIKRDTRHFAKRQLTWFRRDDRIKWFNVENSLSLTEIANEICQIIEGQFFSSVE